MTIYHLLDKPVRRMPPPDTRIEWVCICGLRAALPPTQVPRGTAITVQDKNGDAIIECAACYQAVDVEGERPPPQGAAANEQELNPTFDSDLSDAVDTEAGADENIDEVLKEENEEYPEG